MGTKRRIYLRKQVSFRVDVKKKGGLEIKDASPAKLLDIAGGGVSFTSKTPFSSGESLILMMYLPAGPLEAEAEVVRCESEAAGEYSIAAKFTNMAEEKILLLYTPI